MPLPWDATEEIHRRRDEGKAMIADRYPGWEAYTGDDRLWHARIPGKDGAGDFLTGESAADLADRIRRYLAMRDY